MRTMCQVILVVSAAAAAACGGNGDGGPVSPSTEATLAGAWKATRAEFVSASNSGVRVEIVGLGTTLTLALDSAGTYTQRVLDPGQTGQTTTGTWSASRDVLTLKPAGSTGNIQFDMSLVGSTLTLNGGHVWFDVDGDDKDDEALAYFTLARQ